MIGNFSLMMVFEESKRAIAENLKLKKLSKKSEANTKFYSVYALDDIAEATKKSDGKVSVISGTTFDTARMLVAKYDGKKVAALNFANAFTPGGGVKKGCTAQEECLCRCSTLYYSLKNEYMKECFYDTHKLQRVLHPHNVEMAGVIYSPDVVVFRSDNYDFLDEWKMVDVITTAAPDLRLVSCSEDKLREIFTRRIKAILDIAIDNKVDVLVLGAFGCGAFKNPPKLVARIFKEQLESKTKNGISYKECFDEVVFAIRKRNGRENENFEIFNAIEW